ncbi:MAG: DUF3098 domain-containing protein [Bacteroidota bacterium]
MEKKKDQTITKSPGSVKPVKQAEPSTPATRAGAFAFGKENYRLMLIGLALIVFGFLLMIGGGSKDPNQFNPEIFSFRRITLAPILILAGYVVEIFAIMKKPKD